LDILYICEDNQLISLKGCPDKVGGQFFCDEPLRSFYKEFSSYEEFINSPDFNLPIGFFQSYEDFKKSLEEYHWLEGNKIIKVLFKDAIKDPAYGKPGMIVPDKIEGYEYRLF